MITQFGVLPLVNNQMPAFENIQIMVSATRTGSSESQP